MNEYTPKGRISLEGVNALVFGVRNSRSIGTEVVNELFGAGANIAALRKNNDGVKKLKKMVDDEELFAHYVGSCDITKIGSAKKTVRKIQKTVFNQGEIDFVVHSIAGAGDLDCFKNPKLELSPKDYLKAIEISSLSLLNMIQATLPYMAEHSSYVSMSFIGAEVCLPIYHPMDAAKAALQCLSRNIVKELAEKNIYIYCISAPPVMTLSARAIPRIKEMIKIYEKATPLIVDQKEIGRVCVALASGYLRSLTGSVLYADGGFHLIDSAAEIFTKHPEALQAIE